MEQEKDICKNAIDADMQIMMDQLQVEWERSGAPYKRVTVNIKDLEYLHMVIPNAVMENAKWLNKDRLSFKHCLKVSKENFILLRLAKKIKKAEEKIKRNTLWIYVDLDREEAKEYRKLMK